MNELLNKVRTGLVHCNYPNDHIDCPYEGAVHYNVCTHQLLTDAIDLIDQQAARIAVLETAQRPRLLTLDEITKYDGPVYVTWQALESGCWAICPPKEDMYRYREWDTLSFSGGPVNQPKMKYGKTWCCWTQQPTKKQREAVLRDE